MSNWISSKLKVAETLLNQIDQQAAESLKKGEGSPSDDSDESKHDKPIKSSSLVSLKEQLKKKPQENNDDHRGKLHSDPSVGSQNSVSPGVVAVPKSSQKQKSTLTDSDWTELLNASNQTTASGTRSGNVNASPIRGLKKDVKRVHKPARGRSDVGKLKGKPGDGEESGRSSNELQNSGKTFGKQKGEQVEENGGQFDSKKLSSENLPRLLNKNQVFGKVDDGKSDVKVRASIIRDNLKKGLSRNDESSRSDSESGSGSSSDSESEREREERRRRREKILAEKAAARAVEAIKERENMIAKLEGEKQSLEKILEEQAKQQVQEASKLQTTMVQAMKAAELEKQKHNNTRMEALGVLAKLETTTGDLARSLASKQKNLEAEIDHVAELRQEIELKELAHGELRRRISNTCQSGSHLKQSAAAKGVEFEQEILEAEYSFITDKIEQMLDKAKKLESNIEITRKELEDPTEVEIELKRRLGQLTDHLIQKQAQVESLSSEKATLLFRIEAVSRMLEESNSSISDFSSTDLESGKLDLSNSKFRPLIKEKIRSGRKHLGSLIQQLDAIFLAGVVFLKRNPTAKIWAVVYLVCLHLWVMYIFMHHSQPEPESQSGAVMSLENINRTGV
ncbi:hypothetical protein ACFE04_009271 [Oxalis oulophora]